ncbi:MAG: VCBS repeat-containing protein [Muribaculaceae bacterium]|nr:VCBS repeat-containing protein [Muribaculaceae bacterium]
MAFSVVLCAVLPCPAQRPLSSFVNASVDTSPMVVLVNSDVEDNYTDHDLQPMMMAIDTSSYHYWRIKRDTLPPPTPKGIAVGSIPYTATVKDNGQTLIEIPIDAVVPEYEHDPGISIVYNSGSGMDYMGMGWRLAGIPYISRVPRNYYTDGYVSGVRHDTTDVFEYDGKRLIKTGIVGDTVTMRTQIGNIHVRYNTSTNHFKVLFPDGSVADYTRMDGVNYYRTRLTLADNSVIYYENTTDYGGGDYRCLPSTITYANGKTMTFEFELTNDTIDKYTAAVHHRYCSHLKSISIKNSDNRLLKKYTISYCGNRIRDGVSSIRISYGDGTMLYPLRFSYHRPAPTTSDFTVDSARLLRYYDDLEHGAAIVSRGKFNYGDEDDSFIKYPNKNPYCWNGLIVKNTYHANDQILITNSTYTVEGSETNYFWNYSLPVGTGFIEAFAMDVNGYGGDELVKINNVIAGNQDKLIISKYTVNNSNAAEIDTMNIFTSPITIYGERYVQPKSFAKGDFDGDGRGDLLIAANSDPFGASAQAYLTLVDLDLNEVKFKQNIESFYVNYPKEWYEERTKIDSYKESERILVVDYDGDGKQEVGILRADGLHIYCFTLTAGGEVTMSEIHRPDSTLYNQLVDYTVQVGEFNGDGISDLLFTLDNPLYYNTGLGWAKIYLGRGDGSFVGKSRLPLESYGSQNVIVHDIDRDGVSDVVMYGKDDFDRYYIFTYFIDNGNFSGLTKLQLPGEGVLVPTTNFGQETDIKFFALHDGGNVSVLRYNIPADVYWKVHDITDSFGKQTEFQYARLFNSEYYYPANTSEYAFPMSRVANGMFVCSSMSQSADAQVISDRRYHYINGVVNKEGLGFIGFEGMTMRDLIRGDSINALYDPYNFGVPIIIDGDRTRDEFTFDVDVDAAMFIKILPTRKEHLDRATGGTTVTGNSYDAYGNVTQSIETCDDGWQTSTSFSYINHTGGGKCFIGLPLSKAVTTTISGQSVTTGEATTYNENFLPIENYSYYGNINNKTERQRLTYDGKNRVTKKERRQYSGDWLTTKYKYPTSGDSRCPIEITDETGIITDLDYGDWGVTSSFISQIKNQPPTPVIGPFVPVGDLPGVNSVNGGDVSAGGHIVLPDDPAVQMPGIRTAFEYDSIGRRHIVISPDNITHHTSLRWSDGVQGALYYSEETAVGEPTKRVYYNRLGQVVRQSEQLADSSFVHVDFDYDDRGRVVRQSKPHNDATAPWSNYTATEYDNYDRVINRHNYPSGMDETYTYSGRQVTGTIGGMTATRVLDSRGNLLSVTDGGGTISYTYNPDGTLAEVITGGDITTTFTYDNYGRKIAINDPSAGVRAFGYDDNGYQNEITDARGKTIAFSYNKNGWPLVKDINGEMQVEYTYNQYGNVTSAVDTEGQSVSYSYDALQRPLTVDTDGFRKTFGYTDGSHIGSIRYSLNNVDIATERRAYSHGTLSRVTLGDSTIVWSLDELNGRGLPVALSNSALETWLDYDSDDRVVERAVYKTNSVVEVNYQLYDYDTSTGNMSSRQFNIADEERFDYDNLQRLTGYGGGKTVSYDNIGNIISKSDLGTLDYDGASPYAFTFLSDTARVTPAIGQTIAYNAMQLPDTISEGGYTAMFKYYGDGSRSRMNIAYGDGSMQARYYDGGLTSYHRNHQGMETTKDILWLAGTAYTAPAALMRLSDGPTATGDDWRLYYVVRDNQGSIVAVTDSTGHTLQNVSYDPWGNIVDDESGRLLSRDEQPELLLERGFTGHEHLPRFGLINMNARLYEPLTARFLSPDPEVQAPDFTQNLNRYSYCLNNPLRYTDPTGQVYASDEDWLTADEYRALLFSKKTELLSQLDKETDKTIRQDLLSRIDELDRAILDLHRMAFSNKSFGFATASASLGISPITVCYNGDIYMFVDPLTEGSFVHEIKHGGQIALGLYDFVDMMTPNSDFCTMFEVEAYRAQYAYAGELHILIYSDLLQIPMVTHVDNISAINEAFIRKIVENGHFLYNY